MPNELSIRKEELLILTQEKGMEEMLRPFKREIHLFDTYIAGTTRLKDEAVLDRLQEGSPLVLQRKNSKFDSNTVAVLDPDGTEYGYIPEKDNLIFARLMDAGKQLTAKVRSVDRIGSVRKTAIGIYLEDI